MDRQLRVRKATARQLCGGGMLCCKCGIALLLEFYEKLQIVDNRKPPVVSDDFIRNHNLVRLTDVMKDSNVVVNSNIFMQKNDEYTIEKLRERVLLGRQNSPFESNREVQPLVPSEVCDWSEVDPDKKRIKPYFTADSRGVESVCCE